jgi:hypothetical protein
MHQFVQIVEVTWSSGALAYGVRGAPSAGTTSEHNPNAQAECDAGSTAFPFGAGGGGSESAGGGVSSIFRGRTTHEMDERWGKAGVVGKSTSSLVQQGHISPGKATITTMTG